jgi:hypothetical protein
VFGEKKFNLVVKPIHPPSRRHQGPFTDFALNELVNSGQLASNMDGQPPAWIVPLVADREPNPPFGYVVSFV